MSEEAQSPSSSNLSTSLTKQAISNRHGLRQKVLISVGIGLSILIGLNVGVARHLIFNSFQQLEDEQAQQTAKRLRNAIESRLESVSINAKDHAAWDDTYEFVETHNPNYIESVLGDSTFIELAINLFAIFDSQQTLITVKEFDLLVERERQPSLDIEQLVTIIKSQTLDERVSKGESIYGIITTADGPMVLAAEPIVTSAYKGPSRGTLLVGRILDEREIAHMKEMLDAPLELVHISESGLQEAERVRLSQSIALSRIVNESTRENFIALPSLDGDLEWLLRGMENRKIYQKGVFLLKYFISGIVILGIICAVVWLIWLEKNILARLSFLTKTIHIIGLNPEMPFIRTHMSGDDELSYLSSSIDWMLDRLEFQLPLKYRQPTPSH